MLHEGLSFIFVGTFYSMRLHGLGYTLLQPYAPQILQTHLGCFQRRAFR